MKISVDWLANGRNADRDQAATVCHLRIDVDGTNVTEMRREGIMVIRQAVTVPAIVLAEGLAYRWWTVLYGRGRTTRFRSFREGFALPDIRITPDGQSIAINAEPYTYRNPGVSFLNGASEHVTEAALKKELTRLINDVLKRLRTAVSNSALAEQWDRIRHSEADEQEKAFCVAAGALGVDPYAGDPRTQHLIERSAGIFGDQEELAEFLAGEDLLAGEKALDWFESAEHSLNGYAVLPRLAELGGLATQRPPRPWDLGYEAARELRVKLALRPDDRIPNVRGLGSVLGNDRFRTAENVAPNLRAVVSERMDEPAVILGGRGEASALFTMARALGDVVCFGAKSTAPIMSIDGSYRQAANRACAAEFLAPIAAIKQMKRDGWTEEEIAPEFGVSDEVIRLQLHNEASRAAAH